MAALILVHKFFLFIIDEQPTRMNMLRSHMMEFDDSQDCTSVSIIVRMIAMVIMVTTIMVEATVVLAVENDTPISLRFKICQWNRKNWGRI